MCYCFLAVYFPPASAFATRSSPFLPDVRARRRVPRPRRPRSAPCRPAAALTAATRPKNKPIVGEHGINTGQRVAREVRLRQRADASSMVLVRGAHQSYGAGEFLAFAKDVWQSPKARAIVALRSQDRCPMFLCVFADAEGAEAALALRGQLFSELAHERVAAHSVTAADGDAELPLPEGDCAVCLQPLAGGGGGAGFSTMCGHSFHCACLNQVEADSCPVCRFAHSLESFCEECQREAEPPAAGATAGSESEEAVALAGGTTAGGADAGSELASVSSQGRSLWMCLLCGAVGCSRYEKRHSLAHFEATGHAYALSLETQMVWDYTADEFVERIICNANDGKLVRWAAEQPEAEAAVDDSAVAAADESKAQDSMAVSAEVVNNKLEATTMRYNHSLASQLRAVCLLFEDRLATQQMAADAELGRRDAEADALRAQLAQARADADAANQRCAAKVAEARKEVAFLRECNESLTDNQDFWRAKLAEAEAQIADTKEQLRDMMFFVEGGRQFQEKLAEMGDDADSAQVVVEPAAAPASAAASARSGKKKGKKGRR